MRNGGGKRGEEREMEGRGSRKEGGMNKEGEMEKRWSGKAGWGAACAPGHTLAQARCEECSREISPIP